MSGLWLWNINCNCHRFSNVNMLGKCILCGSSSCCGKGNLGSTFQLQPDLIEVVNIMGMMVDIGQAPPWGGAQSRRRTKGEVQKIRQNMKQWEEEKKGERTPKKSRHINKWVMLFIGCSNVCVCVLKAQRAIYATKYSTNYCLWEKKFSYYFKMFCSHTLSKRFINTIYKLQTHLHN